MKGIIDMIIRRRVIGVALLLLLTLLSGYEMFNIVLNADFSTYLRQDDPVVQKFNLIGEEYASKSMALVLIEAEDVFNPATLKLIRDLTDAYEELDGIGYATSLTNVLDFKKAEGGLEVGKLIRKGAIPEGKEDLKRLREYVLSKEMYVKDLVSEDGKSTVIALRLKQGAYEYEVTNEIRRVTETIAPKQTQISYGGMPFLMYHMTLLIIETIERLEPVMILLMLGILFIGFRKAGGVFLPLLVVAFSVIWTVGLMSLFNISLNMLTGIMPIILIAMGSADGIHVMRRYYEKRQIGKEPVDAIKDTFSELGTPIIITTFTTMIGFLSLLISNFSVIQQFGLVTSLGVFMALVVTFFLLPVFLAFSRPKRGKWKGLEPSGGLRFMDRWAELVFRHRGAILVLSSLMVIIAVVIIPRIKKDVDWSLCLKKGSKAHRAEMLLRSDFGGTLPAQALVKGPMKDPFVLKAMRYLERYLETIPSVGEVQSMARVISEMNEVMNARYVVPESKEGVANLWFLVEGEDIVEQMVKEDETEGLIQARLDTWDTGIMAKAMDKINRFIDALPEKVIVMDLREVSREAREALLRIRAERITDNILRDIGRRKITVEREKLKSIVRTGLVGTGVTQHGYGMAEKSVMDYLLSDEAEVASISRAQAKGIARGIVEEIRKNRGIHQKRSLEILKAEIKQADTEDMKELAQTLEVMVRVALGEARVASALEKVKRLLPTGSERTRDLYRDLKGDLWEMNESLIALGADEYKGLPAAPDPTKMKEVPVSFESTGLAAVMKRMEEELVPSQVMSLLLALVLVAIALGLIFRSFAIGLIGVIPICLTILVNFAVMGYFKIGLDSFTAMIASVAIGLGIDTDVHFISCFKREFSRLGDALKALKQTLSTTGVAILINALTVGLGFAVLLFAGGQHVRRFGGLVALTVILSAIFTFTVLPATIMFFKPKFFKGEKKR